MSRLAWALVVLLAAGCSKPRPAPAVARRVVSLSPSTTETMFAIGAGSALVGRSTFCDYPDAALALPEVGGYTDPNVEAILALAPELVTGARGPAGPGVVAPFEGRGIATYFPETDSFAQIDAMILGLGARTGHDDDAKRVVASIDARADAISRAVAAEPKPRVLLLFGVTVIVAAGPAGFANEMLVRAGATNVVTAGGYPTLDFEAVLALDPDVIVNAAIGEEGASNAIQPDGPGWKSVRAVKEGHVALVADETVLRPGPRVAEGLAVLARALHPNALLP
jgi:iron complex transport system substrate-binding protein